MIFDYWIQTTNDFIIKNIDFIDDFEKFYKTSNIEIYVDISTFFFIFEKKISTFYQIQFQFSTTVKKITTL